MKLKDLKEYESKVISIGDVPESFIGTLTSIEARKDKQGRECVFLRISTEEGDVIQKYTPTTIPDLIEAFRKLGFEEDDNPEGYTFKWEQQHVGRARFPRWLPVEVVPEETKKAKIKKRK